jgi:6-phosphofructokinase 1
LTCNLLIAQSGGPTAVINSSISAVIVEAKRHHEIQGIYGAVNGVLGVLSEDFVDLRQEDDQTISMLKRTPSAALGSCRYKLNQDDYARVIDVLGAHKISYLVFAGGNDSMDTAHAIANLTAEKNYDLRVMGVPKTIDNDLPMTDHCPGYGSVARFNSVAIRDAGLDNEAICTSDTVKIVETMGRDTGWITASTALGKAGVGSAPHLIYLPERPFVVGKFLEDVKKVYDKFNRAVICVCEGLRDENGEFVKASSKQIDTDNFGHVQLGGVGDYLVNLVATNLGIKARCDRPGTIQRVSMICASQIDLDEAYSVGQLAVSKAVEGESDKMVALQRKSNEPYECETTLVNLEQVALRTRKVPDEFIDKNSNYVSDQFITYARPLIGDSLPEYASLKKNMVEKLLPDRNASKPRR